VILEIPLLLSRRSSNWLPTFPSPLAPLGTEQRISGADVPSTGRPPRSALPGVIVQARAARGRELSAATVLELVTNVYDFAGDTEVRVTVVPEIFPVTVTFWPAYLSSRLASPFKV
jgi:hypothetical protein